MSSVRLRPVRVLYVIGSLGVGGAERQIVQLAKHLDSQRYAVSVATLGSPGPLAKHLGESRIPVHSVRCLVPVQKRSTAGRAVSAARAAWGLRTLLRQIEPHIVHAFLAEATAIAAAATRRRDTRLIIAKRSLVESIAQASFFFPLMRFANGRADVVHVNSQAVAEDVVAKEGAEREKVRLVYNGVDTSRFYPAPGREWRPAIRVGMMANFIPYKGHAEVFAAFGSLCGKFPSLELWLWGRTGPSVPDFQALAARGGFAKRVRFLGVAENPEVAYRQIDVFVSASHEEGFSNSILEAMATGLPIVATAVGGTVEQIEHGRSGLLVPPREPEALARALEAILSDDRLAVDLGAAARRRAGEQFSVKQMLEAVDRMYTELAPS